MDELQVLHDSMEAVPAPSVAVIERIRRQVDERIGLEEAQVQSRGRRRFNLGHVHTGLTDRRARFSLALTLGVVALLVTGLLLTGGGAPTPRQATRSIGSWQVVSEVTPSWSESQSGPGGGELTCATTSTCYLTWPGLSGDQLMVTRDGGSTWQPLTLAGVSLTSSLSCPSALVCFAGGTAGTASVLVRLDTSTTGARTSTSSLPAGAAGNLYDVNCISSSACAGLVATSALNPLGGSLVQTTDAGHSWTEAPLPPQATARSLACLSSTSCVIGGAYVNKSTGFVLASSAEGIGPQVAALPSGTAGVNEISCASTGVCLAIAAVPEPNTAPCPSSPPAQAETLICGPGDGDLVAEPIVSTNGGASWVVRPLPSSIQGPEIFSTSCPSAGTCWLAGTYALEVQTSVGGVPQFSGGSPLLVSTTNLGQTWTPAPVVTPAAEPQGEDASLISTIQCPTATSCLALGATRQGSTHSLVYSYSGRVLGS